MNPAIQWMLKVEREAQDRRYRQLPAGDRVADKQPLPQHQLNLCKERDSKSLRRQTRRDFA